MRRAAVLLPLTFLLPVFGQQAWGPTGAMNAPHTQQPATLLPNGRVLVVGTLTCNPNCYSGYTSELYDPLSNSWTLSTSPLLPRFNHIAELLPDGKVLVAGGYFEPGIVMGNAELFDPATATWSSTGSLRVPRQFHKSAKLPDGRVLVVGGLDLHFAPVSWTEVYDPQTGAWGPGGDMSVPRWAHTATTLADGSVLVAGGTSTNNQDTGDPNAPLQSAELYDPAAGTWTPAANMTAARVGHQAVLLPDGHLLVAGGGGVNGCLASAELYDPVANRWAATGSMTVPHAAYSLTLLPNGKVLAAAGGCSSVSNIAEIYDPASGTWSRVANLQHVRESQSATLLQDGKVLVAGGSDGTSGDDKGLATAEVFGSAAPQAGGVTTVSAASYFDNGAVAPDSLASAFGSNLAASAQTAPSASLPTTLAGVSVTVQDSAGKARQAGLLSISQQQINYLVPLGTAAGAATVTINQNGGAVASGPVLINTVAPGIFSADGSGHGLAAAILQRVHTDGTQSYEPVARFDPTQKQFVPVPIDLSSKTDQVFLLLYGTGLRSRSALSAVRATIGSAVISSTFAGPAPDFPGLDQVNLRLPGTLAGSGQVKLSLSVDGFAANTVLLSIH